LWSLARLESPGRRYERGAILEWFRQSSDSRKPPTTELAFALQDDGWYLRADIVWNKLNAMPESVKDRPTRAHEYLFMFTMDERYCYNRHAVIEPNGRNARSVWNTHTQAFPGAHFATFPPKLVEPCVKASSRPGDFVLDTLFRVSAPRCSRRRKEAALRRKEGSRARVIRKVLGPSGPRPP
jgi:DNA methylase